MSHQLPPQQADTLTRRPRRLQSPKAWQVLAGFSVVGCVLLAGAGVLFAYLFNLMQATPTTLIIEGETRFIDTHAETVSELLNTLNITLYEGDELSVDPETLIEENMVVTVRRARTVTIVIDGESQVYRTQLTNPAEILTSVGITVSSEDQVRLDGTLADPLELNGWQIPVNQINIKRAVEITLIDGAQQIRVRTAGENVGEALFAAGVELYLADSVSPDIDMPLTDDMTITVNRSIPTTIIADGVSLETRTQGDTVGDVLAEAQIALLGLDYTIPGEDVPVRPGMSIRVIRVTEEVISETELIPFEDENQPDPSLELDQIRLIQSGTNGIRRTDTRIRYENGVEVSREPEGTSVIREPENRIIAYGTGIVLRTVQTDVGPREYWRKVRLYTSSYHPAAVGGDNITATGRVLQKGVVGVDPTFIPYGTEVYVPGYGIGVAADTGAPRSTKLWIELGYSDDDFKLWTQYTDVYILAPVPRNIPYILPD